MAPRPKTNAFFQTAIADPALKLTSHEQRVYRSVAQPIAPPPLSGSIKVVVSSHPATQRIWILPKALLVEHSNYFSNLVQDPTREEILLQDTLPSDFQNFVDFIHSSIYSLNIQVSGYRKITQNTLAHLLGVKLGAQSYSDAALRQLYEEFEPLAKLRKSSAKKSSIKASDVAFICTHTESGTGSGIRQLFFDAVTSHWTQEDAFRIGAQDDPTDTVTWTEVYNTYFDFRATLASSLRVANVWREEFLKPVEEYMRPQDQGSGIQKVEAEEPLDAIMDEPREGRTRSTRALPMLPVNAKRRSTSDRRRRERPSTPELDMGYLRSADAGKSAEEAIDDGEGMDVDSVAAPGA